MKVCVVDEAVLESLAEKGLILKPGPWGTTVGTVGAFTISAHPMVPEGTVFMIDDAIIREFNHRNGYET